MATSTWLAVNAEDVEKASQGEIQTRDALEDATESYSPSSSASLARKWRLSRELYSKQRESGGY